MTAIFCHDVLRSVVYSDDPVLLLFGDLPDDLARGREAAARASCHVADAVPIESALERLDRQIAAEAVILFARSPSDALDRLLDRLTGEARAGRLASIVVASTDMLDVVARTAFHDRIDLLVDPDLPSLKDAVQRAVAPAPSQVNDVARGDATMLQQLSEDAARIAAILASMSASPLTVRAHPDADADDDDPGIDAGHVRSIIRARRLRDQFFRGELFADPAFDMLLDLYASRLEGDRVAVSSLCIAAAVPATTALRWIKALTERGLFVRSADPQDGRRVYIELSNESARAMGHYLNAVQRAGVTAI